MTHLNILVLTDFSPAASAAQRYAIAMARRTGSTIRFVYAADKNDADSIIHAAYEEFNSLEQKIKTKFRIPLRYSIHVIPTDDIRDLVLDFVRKEHIGLIIMGTRSTSGIDRMFGSTTLQIIKSTPVPVIAVPENARFKLKKIVMATDNRNVPAKLKLLRPFAKLFNAFITVLHVVKPREAKGAILSAEKNKVRLRTVRYSAIEFSSIVNKDVPDGIQTYLSRRSADLLTLFPKRHGIFDQLLGRSITRELSFEAKIPLLIVNNLE